MKLIDVINDYVTLQQSLGKCFKSTSRLLRQFGRAMDDIQIGEVRPQPVTEFLRGTGLLSATWALKYRVLSGLYRFAVSRGYVSSSPLPSNVPKLPPQQTPYVYSTDELRRPIDATSILHASHSRFRAPMYRTLLILLYGSGLRIGEALRLTLRDVDVVQRIITVRNTKFFKTRLVPIGPKLAEELAAHIARRRQLSMPAGEDSALFATRTGRAWYHQHVVALFQQVRRAAQIGCPTGELRPPRLHDLRHTAAVHRVLVWYRSGKDVQRLLPQLATYLGHVEIKSTQRYLQMTPELLQEASRRFAHYSQLGAAMNDRNLLGPWVRRFLLEHLLGERNLSRNTQVSYRDTLTLLLPFASAHGGRPIDRMTVEDLSPTIVRQFLDHLERDRHCNGVTRNQRLCAIHSLARFVGMRSPVHLAWCTEVRSIPFKKTAKMQISYLEKAEMDALLKQPDQRTALGARDHALLLFLYNSGARADEAAQLTIGSLRLSHPPSVRILGKGNKIRMCPLWTVTSSLLTRLIACRDPNDAVFLGRTNKSMTRFGIHRIVAHYATLAGRSVPSLIAKRVSPHTIRHTTAVHLLRAGVDINTILEMKAKTLASLDISKLPPRSRRGIALPSLMAFLEGL